MNLTDYCSLRHSSAGWKFRVLCFTDSIKLLGTASSEANQRNLDRVYQLYIRWRLSVNLNQCLGFKEEAARRIHPAIR